MPESLLDGHGAGRMAGRYECHFEEEFLAVPQECLILTMQTNQKYFALTDANGKLRSRFLIVSNLETATPEHIIQGNERVVRPRLSDAKFFFEQDKKKRWHRVCLCWRMWCITTSWVRKPNAQSGSKHWPEKSQRCIAMLHWQNVPPCWQKPIC
jgi:hypothetical protein